MLALLFSILTILVSNVHCDSNCDPSSKWMRESKLDTNGKMMIRWNFTDTDLTMMMTAETTGWLAVGFGPKRENFVDIVLGWVSKNGTNLQDRYINNNATKPTLDKVASIKLLGGNETKNSTYICFRRKLIACDDQDYSILDDSTVVTWMYSKKDPVEGDFQFESVMNGTKFQHLLSVVYPKPSSDTYKFVVPNTTVSSKMGTSLYWCSYHAVEPVTQQYYMTGFDSSVQKKSMGIIHHMGVYSCVTDEFAKIYKTVDPQGHNCDDKTKVKFVKICRTVIAMWAMGGEDQYFPPSTGTPFGSTNTTMYYRIEAHYSIPPELPELIDSSGMLFYITKTTPKNILAFMFTGYKIAPVMVIPPGQKNFEVISGCYSKCLQQNIPKSGLTVVALRFHGHKTATKFKLQIFRNNQELKPHVETNFDFEFQGFRFLKNEVKLLPNDRIVSGCTYDTSSKNQTIVGNEATEDEMCIIYIMYYPRMDNLDLCMSFIQPENILNLTGLQEIGPPEGIEECKGSDCQAPIAIPFLPPPIPIKKPPQYANQTLDQYLKNFTNWTPTKVQKLKQFYLGEQNAVCSGKGGVYNSKVTDLLKYPSDATPYKNPDTCRN